MADVPRASRSRSMGAGRFISWTPMFAPMDCRLDQEACSPAKPATSARGLRVDHAFPTPHGETDAPGNRRYGKTHSDLGRGESRAAHFPVPSCGSSVIW